MGDIVGAIVVGLLFAISLGIGVAQAVAASEPVYWGTFTAERCEPSRFGCSNIGTWVSDDATLRKAGIRLDGAIGPVDSVRAAYRPTGPLNDEVNNIVHTEFGVTAGFWLPWVLAAFCGSWMVILLRRVVRRSRSRLATEAPAPSLRSRDGASDRLIAQRVRNRVMEYLELASSFAAQREYRDRVPQINMPFEIINKWEDWTSRDAEGNLLILPVYSTDEADQLRLVQVAWQRAADSIQDYPSWPTLEEAQGAAGWEELRVAASMALTVFERRGRFSDDEESPW